jgi:hypothetical protein
MQLLDLTIGDLKFGVANLLSLGAFVSLMSFWFQILLVLFLLFCSFLRKCHFYWYNSLDVSASSFQP